MKHRKIKVSILLSSISLLSIFSLILTSNLSIFLVQEKSNDVQNLKLSDVDYTNATVISDGYMGVYWNNDYSWDPVIIVDDSGKKHVVWEDYTDGVWGTDHEILYASYTEATGWSNVSAISDGYNGSYWNDGNSKRAAIAVDGTSKVHVVWDDTTSGVWGSDFEIMYVSYTEATGWSNVSVISDGYNGSYWNDGDSKNAAIAVDTFGNVHVVWDDTTSGVWGGGLLDDEIMYAKYTEATGWSNVSIISDGFAGVYWNNDWSVNPDIEIDSLGDIHVFWQDSTDGGWGIDTEIMYVSYTEASGWSNMTIISDGFNDIYWNTGNSYSPSLAIDSLGNIHIVWYDSTSGIWGSDYEIMYSTLGVSGWSFPKVISDGYMGVYWNIANSMYPSIVLDGLDNIHVVWQDDTDGGWGLDSEIMYTSFSEETGWMLPKVISDGYNGSYWNDGHSYFPSMAYGNEEMHVVWQDWTIGVWGGGTPDREIMYSSVSIDLNPSAFALSTNAGSPDSDGVFDLIWTESGGANNYSVYNHSSYISEINSSVTLIQDGLTIPSLILTGYTNGTFYIVVEAVNEFGSTLSNCISVEVQLPYIPQIIQTPSGGSIPFGNFYLVISFIGVIYLIIHIKRKF